MDGSRLTLMVGEHQWSALYVDGKLDRVGDHDVVNERIREVLGIDVDYSNDFMRGGEYREDVAKSLNEVSDYRAAREEREQKANLLRAQAAELIAQADEIMEG